MITVGQYVTHASTQLNDQRHGRAFTRWGRGLLLEYLNLGISEISTYRPESFAVTKEVTLKPGITQTVEQSEILSVESNVGGPPIREADSAISNSFAVYDICPPSIAFVNGTPQFYVRSYSIDKHDAKKFYVEPAVPNGLVVKVNVAVPGTLPQFTLADWDKPLGMLHKFDNNLIDFMMAKAYKLDAESPESRRNSESLMAQFYNAMGVKYKQESKYRSGYYLGETGTGNPRAD